MMAESMDGWIWLNLTIVNQVLFLANMYAESNKFCSLNQYQVASRPDEMNCNIRWHLMSSRHGDNPQTS